MVNIESGSLCGFSHHPMAGICLGVDLDNPCMMRLEYR
jgi:hypothetical protein